MGIGLVFAEMGDRNVQAATESAERSGHVLAGRSRPVGLGLGHPARAKLEQLHIQAESPASGRLAAGC